MTIEVWNSHSEKLLKELKGHSGWVLSVAISQKGTTIVSGSSDKTVRVWNSHSGKLLNELKGHSDWVRSVSISQDESTIVSDSDDKTIRVWNLHSGKLLNVLKCHLDSVRSVAISLDGTTILDPLELFHTNLDLVVDHWVVKAGKRLFWIPPSFRPTNLYAIELNNIIVAVGTKSGRMVIFSVNSDNQESATVTKRRNKVENFLADFLKFK
ncbi:WD40-repeat-containing domain protein [Cyathus striatus]|nr:WD40-repeat-containing domain protein [Cyathus striatus]